MTSVIARSMRRLSLHAHDCLDVHGKIERAEKTGTRDAVKNHNKLNVQESHLPINWNDMKAKTRFLTLT